MCRTAAKSVERLMPLLTFFFTAADYSGQKALRDACCEHFGFFQFIFPANLTERKSRA